MIFKQKFRVYDLSNITDKIYVEYNIQKNMSLVIITFLRWLKLFIRIFLYFTQLRYLIQLNKQENC